MTIRPWRFSARAIRPDDVENLPVEHRYREFLLGALFGVLNHGTVTHVVLGNEGEGNRLIGYVSVNPTAENDLQMVALQIDDDADMRQFQYFEAANFGLHSLLGHASNFTGHRLVLARTTNQFSECCLRLSGFRRPTTQIPDTWMLRL